MPNTHMYAMIQCAKIFTDYEERVLAFKNLPRLWPWENKWLNNGSESQDMFYKTVTKEQWVRDGKTLSYWVEDPAEVLKDDWACRWIWEDLSYFSCKTQGKSRGKRKSKH